MSKKTNAALSGAFALIHKWLTLGNVKSICRRHVEEVIVKECPIERRSWRRDGGLKGIPIPKPRRSPEQTQLVITQVHYIVHGRKKGSSKLVTSPTCGKFAREPSAYALGLVRASACEPSPSGLV